MASRKVSDYTFYYHSRAMFFEGVWAGALATSDVVARKAFGASPGWIVVLTTLPQVALFSGIYFARLARREDSNPNRFLWAGVFGRLILTGIAFSGSAPPFILFLTLSTMMQAYLQPAWNALYQANYSPGDRGRRFGLAAAISALTTIFTATTTGHLLDIDQELYRWIYPFAGVCGFLSCYFFSKIRPRWTRPERPENTCDGSTQAGNRILGPIRDALEILKRDKAFRRFEIGYFVYGTALMLLLPVIPIYLVDILHADYSQAARAKGVILFLMLILFQPIAGRFLDRGNPVRISALAFFLLCLFPIPLAFFESIPVTYASFAVYGIGIALVNVAWSMGPLYFAKQRDSSAYMGVHISLVAVRALIGNLAGWFLLSHFGPSWAFAAASALFAFAAVFMRKLDRSLQAS